MPTPGFPQPALASVPPAGNLYFSADQAVIAKSPGELQRGDKGPTYGQQLDLVPPPLMFGAGAVNGSGEVIVKASNASRGHWSDILNFHGSPAPWVLIGILLAAGILHLSAKGSLGFGGRV